MILQFDFSFIICLMKHRALLGHIIMASTAFISIPRQKFFFFFTRLTSIWGRWKKEFFCFYKTSLHPNSIRPNDDKVYIIKTAVTYSSNEHHSASSSSRWVEQRRERKTIMFLSSKLCLLIVLLLGWLLMDITFHAVPQAAVWSSAFWNERSCDAPLKLVQHGIIHHLRHCQRGAAASPCLPLTMGLQREALSATSQCFALHWATEIAL